MAFLCPSRLGRRKHKKGYYSNMMVQSSGSESFDALNKLELGRMNAKSPESRRIIMQTFTSCDAEELTVKQGQKVTFIFREGDWAYVATDDDKEGFVPFIYCAKLGPSPASAPAAIKDKFVYPQSAVIRPSNKITSTNETTDAKDRMSKEMSNSFSSNKAYHGRDDVFACQTPSESVASTPRSDIDIVQAFFQSSSYEKLPEFLESFGQYPTTAGHFCSEGSSEQCSEIEEDTEDSVKDNSDDEQPNIDTDIAPVEVCTVLYNYEGSGPDDISAEAGEKVCVMDGSDPFLVLVLKEDRTEGYIPKYYIQKLEPESGDSPRSNTYSISSANIYSETDITPRSTNATPTNTGEARIGNTDDPVVVPCNTQFTKINITDPNLTPADGKRTPVKPPRTNKPKSAKLPTEDRHSFKRESSFVVDGDDSLVVEMDSVNSDGSQESLSESVRLELIHRELEKLTPLQHRDSMHNSMSSFDDSVFEINVHDQLDQLRPTSVPPYKVYKYEREKAEYYDEYFFDEPEPKIKNADKDEVINVAEILEIRDALRKVKDDERKAKLKPKVHHHGNISTHLKQYMLALPTTVLGHDGVKHGLNTSKDGKGTRRYYVSQVEENEDMLYSRPIKVKHKQGGDHGAVVDLDKSSNNKKGEPKNENLKKNDKTEKVTVNLKKHDWSFGYPRKTKNSNIDVTDELNDLNKPDKDKFDDVSATDEDIQDWDMENLLDKTGGLLDQSKQLLTKKPRYRTANPPQQKESPERNIEFTNPTEKCNHYLTNLILNGANISKLPSETSNEHTEDENVSNEDPDETLPKCKPEFDENKNIKLSHGICVSDVEKEGGNDKFNLCDDIRGITEFVVQYDYTPTADMAIPVVRGEVLHIGLDHQEDTEWYWAYSPRLRTHGYVPKIYVRIPMVTII